MRKKCIGEGTYHRERDFDIVLQSFETWSWDLPVEKYIQKAGEVIKASGQAHVSGNRII